MQLSLPFSACVMTAAAAEPTGSPSVSVCDSRVHGGAGTSLIVTTVVKFCAESGFCNCCIGYLIYMTNFNKLTQNVRFGKGLSNSGTFDLLK